MSKLLIFETAAKQEVANHSIYVWGASGQLCKDVTEKWIRAKEQRNEKGKHADDAVAAWREVMASPYADVARCFDCSGYISFCLNQAGALNGRRDCDGLYAKCDPVESVEDGTLLFRASATNPNDETHVGVFFGGMQYHAKGRKDKVKAEPFKASYWKKYGWFKTLDRETGAYIFTRVLKYGRVGQDVVELKKMLIAHGFDKGITIDTVSSKRFGSSTKKMVKEYQRSVNLKADGIAGHDTIIALGGVWLG